MATISIGAAQHAVSDRLYGVFLEDINYAVDGGLNANLVNNYSFDGVYLRHRSLHVQGRNRWQCEADPLRFWRFVGLRADSCGTRIRGARGQWIDTSRQCPAAPIHDNSRYARIAKLSAGSGSYIENLGYNGGGDQEERCAMAVEQGTRYAFSAMVRTASGRGRLMVSVLDEDCTPLTDVGSIELPQDAAWHPVRCELTGLQSRYGKLRIDVRDCAARHGTGTAHDPLVFDLDCVSLMRTDHWGAGDAKWRYGKLRRDLVEAIAALKPAFVRFPGGCIAEGVTPGNEYRWKDTVGSLAARAQKPNLWAYKTPDGSSYAQSYQIGFYEYFCLCEDLGARPLPTLFAGISCQSPYRDPQHMPIESAAFRAVLDDYLDLIDFANGDPASGGWAGVRAAMGHPEPFGLDMIGIGNENFGADYRAKFDAISSAIHERHPGMLCVMSAGLVPHGPAIRPAWHHARLIAEHGVPGATGELLAARGSATGDAIIVDEHSYHAPSWFRAQASRYDDYPRDGAGAYVGEYSANGFLAARPQTLAAANQWHSALAEAAFLTGCERNSDVVRMTSYAPLLALAGGRQWNHNLIEFNPMHVSPTVNYEAERLFSAHVGAQSYVVQRSFDADADVLADAPGSTWLGRAKDALGLADAPETADEVFVSATGEDRPFRRFIKIVNTGDASVPLTIDVALPESMRGVQSAQLVVRTLAGQPHAKNVVAFDDEPVRGIDERSRRSVVPADGDGTLRFAMSARAHSIALVELTAKQ